MGKKLNGRLFRVNGKPFRVNGELFRVHGKVFHIDFSPCEGCLGECCVDFRRLTYNTFHKTTFFFRYKIHIFAKNLSFGKLSPY